MLLILVVIQLTVLVARSHDEHGHWKVSDWWAQNKDYHNPVVPLKLTVPDVAKANAFINKQHRLHPPAKSAKGVPITMPDQYKKIILKYFSKQRTATKSNTNEFRLLKDKLKNYITDMGLVVIEQAFWPPESCCQELPTGEKRQTSNLFSVIPGYKRGQPGDEILVIGAHYDTVRGAPGVDDNGSGSAAVLEFLRLIAENQCKFDKTLIFALFDMEEDGLKGSKHFVKDYLIPTEVNKNRAKVVGAIIMDMILEYDPRPGAQLFHDWNQELPDWVEKEKKRGSKGDFAAIWARKQWDTPLFDALAKNWINKDKYGLSLMGATLPRLGEELSHDPSQILAYHNLARSDHSSFWYPTQHNITFPAVLIHDLGPWRNRTINTYHDDDDDTKLLTEENVSFATNSVNSVMQTIVDLAGGKCADY